MPEPGDGGGSGTRVAPPAPSGTGLRWGWRLLLFLSLVVGAAVVLARLLSRVPGSPEPEGRAVLLGLGAGLPAALFASWVMMSCVESRPLAELGLRARKAAPELAAGTLIGTALIGVLLAAYAAAGWIRWEPAGAVGAGVARGLLGTALFLGLAAFLEELLFRGYPLRLLAGRFGGLPAIVATGAAFAAAHGANPGIGALALSNTFLAGILLGVLYWRTFSLWLVTGAHFGWNGTMSLLADLPVSGLDLPGPAVRATLMGPDLLTGGAYGPEGGLALLVVLVPAIGWASRSRLLRRDGTPPAPNPLPGRRAR